MQTIKTTSKIVKPANLWNDENFDDLKSMYSKLNTLNKLILEKENYKL